MQKPPSQIGIAALSSPYVSGPLLILHLNPQYRALHVTSLKEDGHSIVVGKIDSLKFHPNLKQALELMEYHRTHTFQMVRLQTW